MQRHEVSDLYTSLLFMIKTGLPCQRLVDDLFISTLLRTPGGGNFMAAISNAEILVNSVTALCSREQYRLGMESINFLRYNLNGQRHDCVAFWPSVFSAIGVIVNRVTPSHRDKGSCPQCYDLLLSMGTHTSARLKLSDVQAELSYRPGTIVLVCGRVLRHAVESWEGGDRICCAHYVRDNVHNRMELPRPNWVEINLYRELMDEGFRARQGLSLE
ncbi:MAG: hypothetical protein QOE33_3659 [Acidobacteriota bacterium]|nr:hypothetical protein [Acidobacteriota bacterium]